MPKKLADASELNILIKIFFVEILINYLWKDDFYSNEFLK